VIENGYAKIVTHLLMNRCRGGQIRPCSGLHFMV